MPTSPGQFALRGRTVAVLLVLFAGLVLLRMPAIVAEGGRFWAEEGTVYFAHAWTWPTLESWFGIAQDAGYVNLTAGFGTWLGLSLGGLRWAPAITVAIALLVQCLPPWLVLTHGFPWRRSRVATVAAAMVCALVPVSGEVWLNTITSQFHLGLAAALILAAPVAKPRTAAADCAILALATLSGPVATFLLPLFCLRALIERQGWRIAEAVVVLLGFGVQVMVYLGHMLPERGAHMGPAGLLSMLVLHTLVLPLAGIDAAQTFAAFLVHGRWHAGSLLAGVATFAGFYLAVGATIAVHRLRSLAWLLAACLVISLVSFYEALNGTFNAFGNIVFGGRYAYVPIVLNGLLIIGIAAGSRPPLRHVFGTLAVLWLVVGARTYRSDLQSFAHGPPWPRQAALWRKDPRHIFVVWPGSPWLFTLPPGARGEVIGAK